MNKQPLTAKQSAALEETQQRFVTWRKNRTSRSRIPDDLWQAAVDLYHTQGLTINKISRGLRLNYTALKDKICDHTDSTAIDSPADEETAMFIEVPSLPDCSDCMVEIENPSGMKIRMCFKGRVDPAVISLGKYLLVGVP